jgi:putative peptidoglycan lipid II flippase
MAVKLASSLKANRLMLQTALLSIVVNVAGDIVLMRWIGVAGIALAGALVHGSALLFLSMALWRQLRKAGF